jgi:hypothetical protein
MITIPPQMITPHQMKPSPQMTLLQMALRSDDTTCPDDNILPDDNTPTPSSMRPSPQIKTFSQMLKPVR